MGRGQKREERRGPGSEMTRWPLRPAATCGREPAALCFDAPVRTQGLVPPRQPLAKAELLSDRLLFPASQSLSPLLSGTRPTSLTCVCYLPTLGSVIPDPAEASDYQRGCEPSTMS